MNAGTLKLYDLVRQDLHLPDNKAMEFVTAIGEFSERHQARQDELLATKAELQTTKSELKSEMLAIKSELKQDIHAIATKVEHLEIKIDTQMASKVDLADAKSNLKDYYGVLTVAQFIAIVAAIYSLMRFALAR
jgi:chromosome segregation ATPase